jgi:hypothetical protein
MLLLLPLLLLPLLLLLLLLPLLLPGCARWRWTSGSSRPATAITKNTVHAAAAAAARVCLVEVDKRLQPAYCTPYRSNCTKCKHMLLLLLLLPLLLLLLLLLPGCAWLRLTSGSSQPAAHQHMKAQSSTQTQTM